ncbi:hypothetical protein [Streptomyces sp. NPDC057694]|uniref:hypothetical protein n=1 Tax=Streptomyces sp. NPDC057694 TaxID=3346216 RepID=UPI00368BCB90
MRDAHAPIPWEKSAVSTLALLVAVLLCLVSVLFAGGLAYLAYRHPATREPMVIAIAAVGVMAGVIFPIATR